MNRKFILWFILDSIFIVVFNVFFFVLAKDNKPMSVWVNYGIIHFAYLLFLATPLLARGGKAKADYRRPLYVGTSFYFMVALLVGIVFIIASPESIKASCLIHLVLFAIAAVYLLSNMIANEHTAENIERQEQERQYVKDTATQLRMLETRVEDKKTVHQIERLYDVVSTSPLRSNEAAQNLERRISKLIDEMQSAITESNNEEVARLCNEAMLLADQRNLLVK